MINKTALFVGQSVTVSIDYRIGSEMREGGKADPWPTSQTVWQEWLIGAIGKIKGQKQRPSAERICHAVRQTHAKSTGPILQDELILARLTQAVADGKILKVCNKGQTSYKEPNHHTRQLVFEKGEDLTKVHAPDPCARLFIDPLSRPVCLFFNGSPSPLCYFPSSLFPFSSTRSFETLFVFHGTISD